MHCLTRLAAALAATLLPVLPTAAQTEAPHAFLFGAWTGGLFPPPSTMTAQQCLAQPIVIFTRDVVMRVVITDVLYAERRIETARGTGNGVEFRFTQQVQPPPATPFDQSGPSQEVGFGCENPDVLHVQRRGENEISFPGCPEFPYPLVRCPAR